jgi:hypothetical protein
MPDLFQDPEFKNIRHVNDELFAVEQLCKQYGLEDVRHALYRVRAHELAFAEIRVRGRVRRENEAHEAGVGLANEKTKEQK